MENRPFEIKGDASNADNFNSDWGELNPLLADLKNLVTGSSIRQEQMESLNERIQQELTQGGIDMGYIVESASGPFTCKVTVRKTQTSPILEWYF